MSSSDDVLSLNAPSRCTPPLYPGDPIPWFRLRSDLGEDFQIATTAGRTLALLFVDSLSTPEGAATFADLMAGVERFRPVGAGLVMVTADPADQTKSLPQGTVGARILFDLEKKVAGLFGLLEDGRVRNATYVLDARLRILGVARPQDLGQQGAEALALFDRVHQPPVAFRALPQAPVLLIPHVFETQFCEMLVRGYKESGGLESGFMVEREGRTVERHDTNHKRRRDWLIEDQALLDAARVRVKRRIVPEIERAHQFNTTRIERYLVACYEAENQGHFAPHRDNTTRGTAHRRFAVSINLNDDYEGGELVFPEFGQARFKPPPGGACVFSCSLMHQATPVTKGVRYVFVPFLYDDEAAALRDRNLQFLDAR